MMGMAGTKEQVAGQCVRSSKERERGEGVKGVALGHPHY